MNQAYTIRALDTLADPDSYTEIIRDTIMAPTKQEALAEFCRRFPREAKKYLVEVVPGTEHLTNLHRELFDVATNENMLLVDPAQWPDSVDVQAWGETRLSDMNATVSRLMANSEAGGGDDTDEHYSAFVADLIEGLIPSIMRTKLPVNIRHSNHKELSEHNLGGLEGYGDHTSFPLVRVLEDTTLIFCGKNGITRISPDGSYEREIAPQTEAKAIAWLTSLVKCDQCDGTGIYIPIPECPEYDTLETCEDCDGLGYHGGAKILTDDSHVYGSVDLQPVKMPDGSFKIQA